MLENREGQRVPDVTFHVREGSRWKELTSRELFGGKRVVVFSLPGAFTPTCSASHVPRYEELAPELEKRGVDEIVCVSVNDAFVMDAWRDQEGVRNIRFLPDGNGEFTEKMGMLVDKQELGYGRRSWRYSMLVEDGVIRKMFIEPEGDGDPYGVSDADTMLRYLDPGAHAADVLLFTREGCAHCARAKRMLREREIPFAEVPASPRRLRAVAGKETTPQVFADGQYIGGAEDLARWLGSEASR